MSQKPRKSSVDPTEIAAATMIATQMARKAKAGGNLPKYRQKSDVPTAIAVAVVIVAMVALMIALGR